MAGIISSENSIVKIFYDTGAGAPNGSALFTCKCLSTLGVSLGKAYETIPHAGYTTQEVRLGASTYSLNLDKFVESSSKDLKLTDALYYITIEVFVDDRSVWYKYLCKKCRRTSWNLDRPQSGGYSGKASFLAEDITTEELTA